jgi:hypothetical protein
MEFGAGGSTYLATSLGKAVISVDSSEEWLKKVAAECARVPNQPQPRLFKADIGPTGEWGMPIDSGARNKWPIYYQGVWTGPGSVECDLHLIDGRFRVACFMSVVLRGNANGLILFHDFFSRPHYHIVREVCREIARAGDLSAFQIPAKPDRERAEQILRDRAYDPS